MRFIVIFIALFIAKAAFSQEVFVPAVGSFWKSRLTYTETGFQKAVETITVSRFEDGRPVFSGEVFGYKGEIIESSSGTVVYTESCKSQLPKELLTPPPLPNQCSFHLCNPPPIGELFQRKFIVIVELFACAPQVGVYSFKSVKTEKLNGVDVTVGDASVILGALRRVYWRSYVKPGFGETYAESPGRTTEYLEVSVNNTPHKATSSTTKENESVVPEVVKVVTQTCDAVAFGDSLTEGMGASQKESYPVALSDMLGVNVCNFGVSGLTTEKALQLVKDVIEAKPKAVIIILGANDTFNGVDTEITKRNLTLILDQFEGAGVNVVFGGYEVMDATAPEHLKTISGLHREIAETRAVIFIPNVLKEVWGNPNLISSDGLHPNANGYKVIAKTINDEAFGILQVMPSIPKK